MAPERDREAGLLRQTAEALQLPWPFAPIDHYHRMADMLAARAAALGSTLFVGVCGAQGSGKSTLASFVAALLNARGIHTAVMSLDDLYLDPEARPVHIHPLFATRGVPGTHDLALGHAVFDNLAAARAGDTNVIPRFEKAQDRRAPRSAWAAFSGPARIVMLEGWCVGTPPQAASALFDPVNPLEAAEDPDGRWRTQVNASLGGPYRAFFQRLGLLIFLAVPDFAAVLDWRQLQEDKLRARVGPGAPGVMSSAQLRRFVQHYERLTRHALAVMPGRADILLRLDRDQQIMAQAGLA